MSLLFSTPIVLRFPVRITRSLPFLRKSATATTTAKMALRGVAKKVLAREQSEGVGARVRRSIGRPELKNLDPFLMLDEFFVKPPAGFPDHPHRGQETVTYMLEGKFKHADNKGHAGTIGYVYMSYAV